MKRKGYAQVEPNHLSAQYTGQIYAQLPAMNLVANGANTPIPQLENGQFLKYSYTNGCATVGSDSDVDGEWMLVYNEEKLYDERRQHHKDFVVLASDMADGKIYPRLLKTNIGDIFTTNAFKNSANGAAASVSSPDQEITMADLALGNYVVVGNDGWLTKANSKPESGICFQVVPHFSQIKDDGNAPTATYTTTNGVNIYNYYLADMQDAVKLQRIQ